MERTLNTTRRTGLESLLLWSRQTKLPLSLAISAAAMTGFIIGSGALAGSGAVFFVGILTLAAGCGALNNYQDRDLDLRYKRTCRRPLPSGRIGPGPALVAALALIGLGLLLLTMVDPWVGALGGGAVGCYNGIYTTLKRRTIWALAPGVVCGMLPPLMGWLAAGGSPTAIEVWLLMIVFAVWQIPHFWLLMLCHGDEYRGKAAVSLPTKLTPSQIERIVMVWVTCLGALMLCLPLVGLIQSPWVQTAVFTMPLVMAAIFLHAFLSSGLKRRSQWLFTCLNSTVFFCLSLLITEHLRLL